MRRLFTFFNRFIARRAPARSRDIPETLPPAALHAALKEARFLHSKRVDVKPLAPGEWPGLPRRADSD